ncbi:MAG: hypothetical protein ACR2NP_16810 [Pirellulaceae bacterium]
MIEVRFNRFGRFAAPRFNTRKWATRYRCVVTGLVWLVVSALLLTTWPAEAQLLRGRAARAARNSPELTRLRMIWGGGQTRTWQGQLRLSTGSLGQPTVLGLEPDSGSAIHHYDNRIELHAIRATDFSGFDLDILAPATAQLTIEMTSAEAPGNPVSRTIELSALQADGAQVALDETGNRLDIQRAPGEAIPVQISRPHLVFEPGEPFEFAVLPVEWTMSSDPVLRLHMELTRNGDDEAQWSQVFDLHRKGTRGKWSVSQPVSIPLPAEQGVYNVHLVLRDESLTSRLNLNRAAPARDIQLVVIDTNKSVADPGTTDVAMWQEVYDSNQQRSQWLEMLPEIPPFSLASDDNSLRNTSVQTREYDGQEFTEFAPGGWQAIPLGVDQLHRPHIVEIEYLDEGPMALGISVLQPDGSGQVGPFGADSGISIPGGNASTEPTVRRHRIFFWPTHKAPYLLFANRHAERSAAIGTIRVLAGPERLAETVPVTGRPQTPSRQYMAFYEKPLFPDNFSVVQPVDEQSGQPWHDWNFFLEGADRWTQYLKAHGYTGAMLLVAGDGSSLYPSTLLQPTPRFDSGVFATTGADPLRKDVVEMLLRVFQREGLTLVPVFHFNSTLPQLEKLRNNPRNPSGIELVDLQGITRESAFRESATPMSLYNPLDPRVQSAFDDVVQEFAERYRGHGALGGMGFLLSQDCVQVMPGQTWGVDQQTLSRFEAAHNLPESNAPPQQRIGELLSGEQRELWLQWRQQQIGSWIQGWKQSASRLNSAGKVFLLGGDLLQTQDAFSALAPSLRRDSSMNDALSRIAFPVQTLTDDPDLVFFQPFEIAPELPLASSRLNIHLDHVTDRRQTFRDMNAAGVLFSHRYSWAQFDQLQKQKLFGSAQSQPLMRLQPLVAGAHWNRRRLADGLLQGDARYLVDGGWLTNLGQEQHTADMIEQFTALPAIPFSDVGGEENADEDNQSANGIVVRQASSGDANYFYALNPTPWKVNVTLQLSSRQTVVESLGTHEFQFDIESDQPQISIELEPFDLCAGSVDASVNIVSFAVQVPDNVASDLQDRLNGLIARVSRAEQAEPIEVLINPGFEVGDETDDESAEFGWYYDSRLQDQVTLSRGSPTQGESLLTLASDGSPTWIRSNEFAIPETGRLSVSMMLRTDQPENQPPLRISIQGSDGRHVYYRYGNVGGDERRLDTEWQEFAVHFDDLPLQTDRPVQIGFDLMGAGQVDIDGVRVYDRWLDEQDSRAMTELLALARFQLQNRQNADRCRRILDGYWPRFLEQFFPDETVQPPAAVIAEENSENRSPRSSAVDEENVQPRR